MRILYLALSYIPSRRASSVQVMKMCAALVKHGHDVELVVKRAKEAVPDDHAHYCVEPGFQITKLSRPSRRGGGIIYSLGLAARIAERRRWAELIYCRDPVGAVVASLSGVPVIFEAHDVPTGWRHRALARAISRGKVRVVAISAALQRDLVLSGFASADQMVVAHDGYDAPRPITGRAMQAPPVVGYVGGLYPGRGVELILELARARPAVKFRLVGGGPADVTFWRERCSAANVEFLGFQPQTRLPALYETMDVVLMPYARTGVFSETRGTDTSRWASPMKMFEYMASGSPIISSDLPVLEEVLTDGHNAIIVRSGDVHAWVVAIDRLLGDDNLRARLASRASSDLARQFTWDARVDRISTLFPSRSAS